MEQKTRHLRYLILLLILLGFAGNNLYQHLRSHNWSSPFVVRIFLNNGDGRKHTDDYLDSLKQDDFQEIAQFLNSQAKKYGIKNDAIRIELGKKRVATLSQPPVEPSFLRNAYWSLKFRAFGNIFLYKDSEKSPDVTLFLSYFDPAESTTLGYSVGLQGGRFGLINVFADQAYQGSNNVIIAHELLHTFGATDKYDFKNNPIFPIGYADPKRVPLYPQERAEIMGGRIPTSQNTATIPNSLNEVVVGIGTAYEIHWIDPTHHIEVTPAGDGLRK